MSIINIKDSYLPFYLKIRQEVLDGIKEGKTFIEILGKGSRYSGKSYFMMMIMIELMIKDPSMSSVLIDEHIESHKTRLMPLVEKLINEWGLTNEFNWESKKTRPVLYRNINGYRQEIRFTSVSEVESAGVEPPINEATGKVGYIGFQFGDELAKKTDSDKDSEFTFVKRFMDAMTTLANTTVRHLKGEHSGKTIVMGGTLNPWGERNPVVIKFHTLLSDDIKKLKEEGYNLGIDNQKSMKRIYFTTNYLINTRLNEESRAAVDINKKDRRADTIVFGITGRTENSKFGMELTIMESVQTRMVPSDIHFKPLVLSLDVGATSPSSLYLIGHDSRFAVRHEGQWYPTRLIAKGEKFINPRTEFKDIETVYKELLVHIWMLSKRYPQIRNGITLYVDGSAKDAIELMKAYIKDLTYENSSFDLAQWLKVAPQSAKFKKENWRIKRHSDFSHFVSSYSLIIDKSECPHFFEETAKIVDARSEQKYDHCYDAIMYGVIPVKQFIETGQKVRAIQGKKEYKEIDGD